MKDPGSGWGMAVLMILGYSEFFILALELLVVIITGCVGVDLTAIPKFLLQLRFNKTHTIMMVIVRVITLIPTIGLVATTSTSYWTCHGKYEQKITIASFWLANVVYVYSACAFLVTRFITKYLYNCLEVQVQTRILSAEI